MSADFTVRIEIPPIHLHLHSVAESSILAAILDLKEIIMASNTELTAKLDAVAVQQQKTIGEIAALQGTVTDLRQSVVDLQAVIAAGGEPPPELVAAVDKVASLAQQVDDAIPDAPPPV
jgi:hypothetical protein